MLLGERIGGPWSALGAVLMLAGVLLHLAERHTHEHAHDPIEHGHAHRHDDGHHGDHLHAGESAPPSGVAHSHWHRHTAITHTHGHVPDDHHAHRH